MHRPVTFVAFIAFAATPAVGADGPFGISMGDKPASFPACKKTEEAVYLCKSLPKTHPDFDIYSLIYSDETGVCKVGAIGRSIEDNGSGSETRGKFEAIKSQISANYGDPSKTFDFLTPGALWDEPGEWLMAVRKKERTFVAYWIAGQGLTGKNNVTGIKLEVNALDRDTGMLVLTFEFTNMSRCAELNKKKQEAVF